MSKVQKRNEIDEKKLEQILIDISNIDGASGDEELVVDFLKSELKAIGYKKFERDNLGTFSVVVKGTEKGAPKTLIESHMDAPAFIVSAIDKDGFIKFTPTGGWWGHVLLGQMLRIKNSKGKKYVGIIGAKPPHIILPNERNKVIDIKNMFLDIGATSKEEVINKFGINVGDRAVPHTHATRLNGTDLFSGNGYDDRAGCAVNFMLLKWMYENDVKPKGDVIVTFSTQEEVGLRGAKTASQKFNADIGFGLDVTIAYDIPVTEKKNVRLRKGVALGLMDGGTIASKTLYKFMENIAIKEGIDYEPDVLPWGRTDASELQRAHDGAYAMSLSIPIRYMHTHHETVSIHDIKEVIRIFQGYVIEMDKNTYDNQIKFK
ncbi:MAG: M20/M25/M40 family metallo-hydrolase [Mycoplasmataceae bacterium]|nr:M20/M25/M40 family metallo-hydrolase [Mycoplasmataceae bacterium]